MRIKNDRHLIVEYVEKVWNGGNVAALEDLTTPGFVYRLGDQPPRDRAAMHQFLATTRSAFPDWRVEIWALLMDRGMAAVCWYGNVTHQGHFHGIPPSGRQIRVSGINVYRIVDGKIAEEWEQTDSLSMLRQLGALPVA